jgi:hypothetical protein
LGTLVAQHVKTLAQAAKELRARIPNDGSVSWHPFVKYCVCALFDLMEVEADNEAHKMTPIRALLIGARSSYELVPLANSFKRKMFSVAAPVGKMRNLFNSIEHKIPDELCDIKNFNDDTLWVICFDGEQRYCFDCYALNSPS